MAAIMLGMALNFLQPVLVPLVLAIALSYVLSPIIELCQRKLRLPHFFAVFVALLVGLASMLLLVNLVYVAIKELARNADQVSNCNENTSRF